MSINKGRHSLMSVAAASVCLLVACLPAKATENAIEQLDFTDETVSDYFLLQSRTSGVMVLHSGQVLSRWSTAPTSSDHAEVSWGISDAARAAGKPINSNELAIKHNCVAGGGDFLWLDAYRSNRSDGVSPRFKIETTRAEMRAKDGHWINISGEGGCWTVGHPYALKKISVDPYSIRVWGKIYNRNGVTVGRTFFWQETLTYIPAVENQCWETDTNRVRPVIRQDEAWWDSVNGWTVGSGNLGKTNEPTGESVTYGRFQMLAKGAGWGWRGNMKDTGSKWAFCLKRRE